MKSSRVDKKRGLDVLDVFFSVETAGGTVLLAATAAALFWANSPWSSSYVHLWETPVDVAGLDIHASLHFLVNEVLMSFFFFVVGLEIRREMHDGALASLRLAALPIAAAAGGVVVPALVYLAINAGGPHAGGWAVPTATDIAFAVGVLSLFGKRVDPALRTLLLALAIADDVAAVLIIAFVYSGGVQLLGIAVAAAGIGGVLLLQKLGVKAAVPYAAPGGVIWLGLLYAGLHPALAGVVLGLLTPMLPIRTVVPQAVYMETLFHPWVAFGAMPLFAFANAGVALGGVYLGDAEVLKLTIGIVAALVIGKPLGILLFTALAVRLRVCSLPPGVDWSGISLIGCLGGIGFTMAIFIATLAFPEGPLLDAAKLAVLAGSVLAGLAGAVVGGRLKTARASQTG